MQPLGAVRPLLRPEAAERDLKDFQDLKSRLLSKADYQDISGKLFIKKSGWRKLSLVFGVSTSILDQSKIVREDGSFVWTFKIRASAPNGRFVEAIAACDSKEHTFQHVEHDVLATASTRATSRAISDLIGGGEVSAEEIAYEEEKEPPKVLSAVTTYSNEELVRKLDWYTKGENGKNRIWKEGDAWGFANVVFDGKFTEFAKPLVGEIKANNGGLVIGKELFSYEEKKGQLLRTLQGMTL